MICRMIIEKKLNNGNEGRTKHWTAAARSRKEWMIAVANCEVEHQGECMDGETFISCILSGRPLQKRVDIVVTRVLGPRERMYDPDSILRGNAKELIDSIVEAGYLADDSAKHIETVVGKQDDSQRPNGPFTIIEIFEAKQ